ncbi:MAG TPA: hypothetical protein VFQ45_16905 [Longimicrobium sp.]|nr:hypothetical protein [Longimicrobium sp.]
MSRSLEDVKNSISGKYLGRAGIHGVGMRRSQGALMVYVHSSDSGEQARLLREIEAEALPYRVVAVEEERPVAY